MFNFHLFKPLFNRISLNELFLINYKIKENQDSLAISGNLESNSFIHFSKILQSPKYSLGKSWGLFITKFI